MSVIMYGKDTTNKQSNKAESVKDFAKAMRKPSRKKHFGKHLAYQLFYQNPESINRKGYQRSIYCSESLIPDQEKGTLYTHRCRCRWCPTCASIQTAQFIAGYGRQLDKLDDLWFVTLTRPTVTADELEGQIKLFQKHWNAITKDRYWKANKPKALRKMECTIRPNGMYHYHFHIIIQGKENAEWIQKKWLYLNPESNGLAQDIRPIKQGQYIEVFKYFTKLLVKDEKGKRYIDFKRLDFVFQTIRGRRIYQPFGGLKKIKEEIDDNRLVSERVPDEYLRIWDWMTSVGYVDKKTGEVLTGDWKLPKWVQELTGTIPGNEEESE